MIRKKLPQSVRRAPKGLKRSKHARFLRYASLHSVNASAATISQESASEMVRTYLEAEATI